MKFLLSVLLISIALVSAFANETNYTEEVVEIDEEIEIDESLISPEIPIEISDELWEFVANMSSEHNVLSRSPRQAKKKTQSKKAKAKGGCLCGMKKPKMASKIVGGSASKEHWPWMASLAVYQDGGVSPFCGGSIICNKYVLSAAHCIPAMEGKQVLAMFGSTSIGGSTQGIPIASIIPFPAYGKNGQDSDIVLLKLAEPIKYTNTIQPICLKQKGKPFPSRVCVVAGWGTTSSGGSPTADLREVRVKTMKNDQCASQYGPQLTNNMLCASAPGKDSCQGDSGGPLFTKIPKGPWTQIGVVSFGKGCADPNYAGVYCRVSNFISWIKSNTKDCAYCKNSF